jgi:hypothetical protein
MKIGILTLPLHTNYGGILQAYALQTILERMGHKPRLIKRLMRKASIKSILRYKCKFLVKEIICLFRFKSNCELKKKKAILRFIKQYIKTDIYDTFEQIKKNQYDVIIVGSDQIWRPQYISDIENAYLNFTSDWNIKRIAYGASFGVSDWEYTLNQTLSCRRLIQRFDAISVREQSAVVLCSKYLGVIAQWVLDPTMLLDKEDYVKIFSLTRTPVNADSLFDYILDETIDKNILIERIANETGLKPFWKKMKNEKSVEPSVIEWLNAFYNAKYVVTDSFHGCVFSILFQKNFIVYGNEKRGLARFQSLLSLFGLENRLVTNLEQNGEFSLEDIDWEIVTKKLQDFRNRSMLFLIMNINNGK